MSGFNASRKKCQAQPDLDQEWTESFCGLCCRVRRIGTLPVRSASSFGRLPTQSRLTCLQIDRLGPVTKAPHKTVIISDLFKPAAICPLDKNLILTKILADFFGISSTLSTAIGPTNRWQFFVFQAPLFRAAICLLGRRCRV